jgi:hypothetical protein
MLSLPASLEIAKLEEFISKVNSLSELDNIELPVETKNIAFGGYAAAIQAVNTWAFRCSEKRLKFKKSASSQSEQIRDAIRHPHKFAALMIAKAFEEERSEFQPIRHEIYMLAKQSIEAQSSNLYGQNRGRLCWYSFVDHSTKGFDRNFYALSSEYQPTPRHIDHITSIISSMVEKSATVAGGGKLPNEQSVKNLGRMFYELFVNTHEHGSRDIDRSKWLKPATRFIYTYGINLTDEALANVITQDENLKSYISGLEKTNKSTRRFVEISIIDSGLGYCGRWYADNPNTDNFDCGNVESEYKILKKCFQFRSSSTKNEIKGNGLPAVMANLTALNGFMRIRSDRLAVYRDFVNQPFTSYREDSFDFLDWNSKVNCLEKITKNSNVRGVAVTVLIPLYDKLETKEVVR